MVKVELVRDGVKRGILKDAGVLAECRKQAERIASACGEGFEVSEYQNGRNRGNVSVVAVTQEAKDREWNDHVVERALGYDFGTKDN